MQGSKGHKEAWNHSFASSFAWGNLSLSSSAVVPRSDWHTSWGSAGLTKDALLAEESKMDGKIGSRL